MNYIEIKGQYNAAKVFTRNLDPSAEKQILELCNQEFVKGSRIRIMPDTHAGAGCTIGTTMTIHDKIVPNLVGVDIGCGMETVRLKNREIDLKELDRFIHHSIPAGFKIRRNPHPYAEKANLEALRCKNEVDLARAYRSVGTLGGGNHFIEVNKDDEGFLYIVVHSGSRHIGKQVADLYQNRAWRELSAKHSPQKSKKSGGLQEPSAGSIPKALAYVEERAFNDYLHDMQVIQAYATLNRNAIIDTILEAFAFETLERFSTIHNYIDTSSMILRKGAVSAQKGEKILIPINMRDGSLLAVGKGIKDWNFSAPHGAGRLMSRTEAKQKISLETYKKTMKGIFSTTVNKSTLDECALAYKPIEEIIGNIGGSVDLLGQIKPIYNFKAAD